MTRPKTSSQTNRSDRPKSHHGIRVWDSIHAKRSASSPAIWGAGCLLDSSESKQLKRWFKAVVGGKKKRLQSIEEMLDWLLGLELPSASPIDAIDVLRGLASLPLLEAAGNELEPSVADECVGLLWLVSAGAQSANAESCLVTKSLGIELGIALCIDEACQKRLDQACLIEEFCAICEANLDNDGWPAARLLPQLPILSASWARSYLMLNELGVEVDFEVKLQLDWMVRQCFRLCRENRSLAFSDPSDVLPDDYWKMLIHLSKDQDDPRLLEVVSGKAKSKTSRGGLKEAAKRAAEMAEPGNLSEWAGSASLRSSWHPRSPMLAVNFHRQGDQLAQCWLELNRGPTLLSGDTLPKVQYRGKSRHPIGDFHVVCDQMDDDVDYLEIQSEWEGGLQLNRQFLLAREGEFLLVADSWVAPEEGKWEAEVEFPLAAGIVPLAETETREIYLQTSRPRLKIRSLVLPLALPEWKQEKSDGNLKVDTDSIVLQQTGIGRALFMPMVFDLSPSRSLRKRTWRSLTVAENRETVRSDTAVAFRFQLDSSQWIFYRALGVPGNRTYLGENTVAEFSFSRFDRNGTVEPLIEVQ